MQATPEATAAQASLPALADNSTSFAYKLARHLFRLPSRMLGRMRQFDNLLEQPYTASEPQAGDSADARVARAQQRMRETGLAPLPGPWGFLTSGYFVGLFFMAFLLNRVQNIVVPPRHSSYHRRIRSIERRFGRRIWTRLLRALVPVNLSSTRSRLVFRTPSIYLLLKSLTLCLVRTLGEWAQRKPMDELCWSTFISVCVALFISSLTSGMEASHSTGNAPFNLFGYSFVLYVYASPMTHIHKGRGLASRPDVHVLITMMLPLLQLTMTHCLEVKKRWGRKRLIPTTIVGVLSLIHFHLVVWCFPSSYPLPNIVPNFVESFLLFVTLVTCTLNALTQLLLNGSITKPLVGHAATLMPKWDEDFSVVLFRLGTASLEATSVAGFGNEVGNITDAAGDISRAPLQPERSTVEINRAGVVSITHSKSTREAHGFANEIKNVKVSSRHSDAWVDALVNATWTKELGRFLLGMWQILRRAVRTLWAKLRAGRPGHATRDATPPLPTPTTDADPVDEDVMAVDADVYERFLRGDELSEDEDDFEPGASAPDSPSTSDDEAEPDDGDPNDESASDALVLYADLSATASGSGAAPLLLAHMTNPDASPLTRRRYSRIVAGRAPPAAAGELGDWGAFVQGRREAARGHAADEGTLDARRHCVICTVEPRDIICWPCRCLALCDDCRENLASRSAASKHLCPCCRRPVEGFSKIYIP
ncbi:hypothetical protein PsYK624_039360 [Phanerochaete sordida]|uniref:RING-type domain-containing protein n=1 Tax=Phanerochaete sordida TaxID=48140 RepID=A0A9P3LBI0_9APHY|nr:hypothetical protein PsYK624_039360 [Phanerochaete sordida]